MLRLSLLCIVAGLAVVSAISNNIPKEAEEWRSVVPSLPYLQNLKNVRQAVDRLKERVKIVLPLVPVRVTDPEFHYLVILGLVERAGYRMEFLNPTNLPGNILYLEALNSDLPEVYRNLVQTQLNLLEAAANTTEALDLLLDLKSLHCGNLDDDDCDKVLEWQVYYQAPPNLDLFRAVAVLKEATKAASTYLKLHEEIVKNANSINSLGYLARSPGSGGLDKLADQHSRVLDALNRLY